MIFWHATAGKGRPAGSMLLLLCVQFHYYIFAYGRIPGYKNSRRAAGADSEPPVPVVVPLFSEDYSFVEAPAADPGPELPRFRGGDRLRGPRCGFLRGPRAAQTVVSADRHDEDPARPAFPRFRARWRSTWASSRRITSAWSSLRPTPMPQTDRWLSLMAKGFMRGEIVSGVLRRGAQGRVFANYTMRTWRMMHSANWIAGPCGRRAYRGTLHNYGFTKRIYFGANGFSHLNMNIGEDDLFMQQVMTRDNVSSHPLAARHAARKDIGRHGLVDEPAALLRFGLPLFTAGGAHLRRAGRLWSRVLFFATAACALAVMPLEYKIAALALVIVRYVVVALEVRRVARRLGEGGIMGPLFIYDLLEPAVGPRRCGSCCSAVTTAYGDSRLYRSRGPGVGRSGARGDNTAFSTFSTVTATRSTVCSCSGWAK